MFHTKYSRVADGSVDYSRYQTSSRLLMRRRLEPTSTMRRRRRLESEGMTFGMEITGIAKIKIIVGRNASQD